MTMSSSVSKVTLNGDGSQTSWPFAFKVWKAADLEISITNAEGVTTVVSNWSVSLAGTGGTVTYPTSGSPLPSGHKITIARSMDFLQDVDLVSGTRWDPEVVETALDIACAERQQLKEKLSRAVTVDIASGTTPEALRDSIFAARGTAVSSAASALDSAERAEQAATTVAYYNHEGTLLSGEDTISLPWAYNPEVGVEVFLSGVKHAASSLTFTDAYTVTLDSPVAADTPFEVVASAGARSDLADILAGGGGSSLVGFLQEGTGAVGRTVQSKLRDFVNVKDFGARGDATNNSGTISGTNDTAAFNAAISACGLNKTLYIPDGVYLLTPGALSEITVSVYGPGATLVGSQASGDDYILKLYYVQAYPAITGTGVTGLYGWRTCELLEIVGNINGDASKFNTGIYCRQLDEARIRVGVIRGCSIGIHINGSESDRHCGTSDIAITHLYQCNIGIKINSGVTAPAMVEANRFTIQYMYGFTNAAIYCSSPNGVGIFDNIFDIVSLGFGISGGHGISFDQYCKRNLVRVRSWDTGPTGAGRLVVSEGENNIFQIPYIDTTLMVMSGKDIFDTAVTDITVGRSSVPISTSAPAAGTWRAGDKAWNYAPVLGGPIGWVCITSGTPGVWVPMCGGRPKVRAKRSTDLSIALGSDVPVAFDTITYNVGGAYNTGNGAFQPSVPGYYRVTVSAKFIGVTPSLMSLALRKNGSLYQILATISSTFSGTILNASDVIYLDGVSDYIQVYAYLSAASGGNIGANSCVSFEQVDI